MIGAEDFDRLSANLFIWHAYDSTVRVDLFSTAFQMAHGTYVVDPIGLPEDALAKLLPDGKLAAVILTNANHERAAREFSGRFHAPIWSRASSAPDSGSAQFHEIHQSAKIDNDIRVIDIDGAAPGEIALCVGRTLILGDALINLSAEGFTFLPAKYCQNSKQMRRSLGQLLDLEFDRMLFAHGEPITVNARTRLRRLLESAA